MNTWSALEKHSATPIKETPCLCVVIPCYNEQEALPETHSQLDGLLSRMVQEKRVSRNSHVCYVDDGSTDKTWQIIEALSNSHPYVRGIKLSRNRGHQNALLAGLLNAEGDAVISIDADLQDDLSAIDGMLEAFRQGRDIVFGVRKSRRADSYLKRYTAESYYRLLALMGVDVVFNHADYRLMSRRAIEALREYQEVNLFLRGIVPQLGFSTDTIYYDRAERFAGESKYPAKKMIALAWQGVTSFSTVPLHTITAIGALVSAGSFFVTLWALWVRLYSPGAVPGWASTVLPIYFLGGVQLLCIGIMGEYLSKIYMETKNRPRYIIDRVVAGRPVGSGELDSTSPP